MDIAQFITFLKYGKLGRLKFLAGLLIMMVLIFSISLGIKRFAPDFAMTHQTIIGYLLNVLFMTPLYLARIRDSGFPIWFVILSLVPGVSFLLTIALLWCKGTDTSAAS